MKTIDRLVRCALAMATAVLSACAVEGQRDAPASIDAVLIAQERASWQAWKDQDATFFARFLSADHVEVTFGGVVGKAAVVDAIAARICSVAAYALKDFKVTRLSTDTAVVTYHATQDTRCGGVVVPSPVWASSLYQRRDGVWLNVLYQQTVTNK